MAAQQWKLQNTGPNWADEGAAMQFRKAFSEAISEDLNTSTALLVIDDVLHAKAKSVELRNEDRWRLVIEFDAVLGLDLLNLSRKDLRIRPKDAVITEDEIEQALADRKAARAQKDFATSDAIRDDLAAKGVEVMDGDPLGWDWKLG